MIAYVFYNSSIIDDWCVNAYYGYLDSEAQDIIPGVSIKSFNNNVSHEKSLSIKWK